MGKHNIDFDDFEDKSGSAYSGPEPTRGIYDGVLVSVKDHESAGGDGLRWVFEITEGEYKGWRGYQYSNFESTKWKTQQIVKAINGGSEEKFVIDTEDEGAKTVKKAKPVRLQVRIGKDDMDEKRAELGRVLVNEDASAKAKVKKKKKSDDPL